MSSSATCQSSQSVGMKNRTIWDARVLGGGAVEGGWNVWEEKTEKEL